LSGPRAGLFCRTPFDPTLSRVIRRPRPDLPRQRPHLTTAPASPPSPLRLKLPPSRPTVVSWPCVYNNYTSVVSDFLSFLSSVLEEEVEVADSRYWPVPLEENRRPDRRERLEGKVGSRLLAHSPPFLRLFLCSFFSRTDCFCILFRCHVCLCVFPCDWIGVRVSLQVCVVRLLSRSWWQRMAIARIFVSLCKRQSSRRLPQ
jgi:hypothetical protein